MKQAELRKKVKLTKALKNITYKEMAEEWLNMNYNSFINWLNGYSSLGYGKRIKLEQYLKYKGIG